jgi:hypothetical protein
VEQPPGHDVRAAGRTRAVDDAFPPTSSAGDSGGVLCGIVSISDLVAQRLAEARLEIDVLRDLYSANR